MDYKQKYEEALKRARDMMSHGEVRREDMEYLFPELSESEDEKIRKELLAVVNDLVLPSKQQSRFVAWLEKQNEQKSSWNEEDEISLLNTLWCCKKVASIAKDENEMGTVWYAERWLKSLKSRL